MTDAVLAELKKQTRMLARKEANRVAGAFFGVSFCLAVLAFFIVPNMVTMTAVFVAPFVGAALGYWVAMRRLT